METIIIPCQVDLEDIMTREKCNAVGIESMSVTYTQPADTNSSSDEVQFLTITTNSACGVSEDEEGYYYDISIPEGQHWSVDDGDSLKALIDDFKKRLYMKTRSNELTKQDYEESRRTD